MNAFDAFVDCAASALNPWGGLLKRTLEMDGCINSHHVNILMVNLNGYSTTLLADLFLKASLIDSLKQSILIRIIYVLFRFCMILHMLAKKKKHDKQSVHAIEL